MNKACDYDVIASGVFAPLFPVVADALIERTGKSEGRMLDVGCGGGHLGFAVMEKTSFKGWFLDISQDAISLCRERALKRGLAARCQFTVGNVQDMSYNDGFFDLIVSRGSIGFWQDYPAAFKEIYRVLAPGGKTYIGKGLGNRETLHTIKEKMKHVEPDWPTNIQKEQRQVSTVEFCRIFDCLGIDYDVLENEDEGRWFILSKPVV